MQEPDCISRNQARSSYSTAPCNSYQVAALMWLAGFYHPTIKITIEEYIADISIQDEDTTIKGRMDILAVNKTEAKNTTTPFWILVIEAKNSSVEALECLPQLLTYASIRFS